MQLNAYLSFSGEYEAAFKFYEECLDGKLGEIFRYAGTPVADHVPAGDNVRGRRHPTPHQIDLVCHFVSLYSTQYEPTHRTAGNDAVRDLLRVFPTAVPTRERRVRKLGV